MLKIPYFLPWINKNDEKEVIKSMRQRWLTNGPYLEQFEKNFSSFIGTKFSSGVNSATSALHLCLRALGINQNDEVSDDNNKNNEDSNQKKNKKNPSKTETDTSTVDLQQSVSMEQSDEIGEETSEGNIEYFPNCIFSGVIVDFPFCSFIISFIF